MTTAGRHMVRMGDDGWAIYSQDGSLAAHFEFTIAITADGPRILTPWHESKARAPPPEPPDRPLACTAAVTRGSAILLVALGAARLPAATTFSSGGLVAVAAPAARATPSGSSAERDHEGTTVGQADVREVQDHPPPRPGPRDLPEPATQAAAGVGQAWLASPGSTSPSTSASRSASRTSTASAARPRTSARASSASSPTRYVRDLTDDEISKLRDLDRRRLRRRGRSAPRALAEHQAPDGDRLLPRHAPPSRPAGPRPEHQDQRAHAQGPEAHAGRRQEEGDEEVMSRSPPPPARPPPGQEEHPDRPGAHQDQLQQHDRRAHRP